MVTPVAARTTDPADAAIIAGQATRDPQVEGIAVYATRAATKRVPAATRAATAP